MVTQVQLGTFFSANGKTVLGGVGGSGLDTEGLIKSLTDARGLPATKLEDKIKTNDSKASALTELKTLIDKFRDAANFLRNPPGVNNAADNVFEHVTSTVTSNTAIAGSNYLTVTVEPGAGARSFHVDQITSIAQATRQTTGNFAIANADTKVVYAAPPLASQFGAGTFTVNGANITLEENDTLNQVAAKFNAVKATSGISASVVKAGDNAFQLLFSGTQTGTDEEFDLDSALTVTSDPSGALSGIDFETTQEATDAEFILDGITITRQNNSIGDAVEGVTFNLLQDTLDAMDVNEAELTIDIKPDTDLAKAGIINFVNVYNDLRTFYAKQTLTNDDGTISADAVLSSNTTLRTIMNTISSQVALVVNGVTDSPNRLSDLGITSVDLPATDEDPFVRNALTIDESKLISALQSNFDGVRKVFEFDFSSTNTNLRVFKRANSVSITDFTLTLTPSADPKVFTATYNNGSGNVDIALEGTAITGGGYKLTGPKGSVLEGLELVYGSSADSTSTIHFSQGIGDLVYNATNDYLKENTGTLAIELQSIQDNTTKLEKDIDTINEQVDRYREQLLAKFGELERSISTVNSLLQSLSAQADARNNS